MLAVIVTGIPATLLTTAAVAVAIRKAVGTPLAPTPAPPAPAPFSRRHYIGWSVIGGASAVAVGAGVGGATAGAGVMLAATVLGYVCGTAAPPAVRALLHPVVACAAAANVAAAALGAATGAGYAATLAAYLTKGAGGAAAGAGDVLMSLLGVVILSYGFRIAAERSLIQRHAAEIGGAAFASAAFSLFATAAVAKAVGLAPPLARALAPRSVTVALALPIAAQLGAPASIAAAGVVLTGLLGANCAAALLDAGGYRDPIARGLATAGAAHGLGTAALARSEPDALPFCALGYALIGVAATLLASLPPVTAALMALTA
jgi:putative effector of murein hydrolase